jgi:alkyl hydroperoxide reductase subunit D
MTQWVDALKDNSIPDYAKDIKLNLDAVIKRSSLPTGEAEVVAVAAAFATGNSKLWTWLHSQVPDKIQADAALTAASLMAMNNMWYPYVEMAEDPQLKGLPAQLRMNAISNHGGTTKGKFEACSLAASIIGKCHFCVRAHYETLKKEGYTVEQLRDIGRIAAVINSVAKIVTN